MDVIRYAADTGATLYECGNCRITYRGGVEGGLDGHVMAEGCCQCQQPDCTAPRQRHYVYCEEHRAESHRRREAERHAEELAKPIIDRSTITCDCWLVDGTYKYDLDDAVDDALDDDRDLADVIVYPCEEVTVDVPDLITYVEGCWGENFDDGYELGRKAEAIIADACRLLAEHRPTMYVAVTTHRIDLAAYHAERTAEVNA